MLNFIGFFIEIFISSRSSSTIFICFCHSTKLWINIHCEYYPFSDFYGHPVRYIRYISKYFNFRKRLNYYVITLILFMMLRTQLIVGLARNKGKIFREHRYRLYKSCSFALRTLYSVIKMKAIATCLAKRVAAKNEEPWNIQFLIKFIFTIIAKHILNGLLFISSF